MGRLFPSLLIGLVISLVLFWLMQAMVLNNQQGLKTSEPLQMVEFIRLKRESKTQIVERKKPKPPPPPPKKRPPPPPKAVAHNTVVKASIPNIDMPTINIPLPNNRFKSSLMSGIKATKVADTSAKASNSAGTDTGINTDDIGISTNVIALVKTPPRYPRRATSRRIEGWVKIEFTITKTGTVTDAVVIGAKPSGIFDRAALRAIAKWKFKAKIVDGKAVLQRAIQVMEFNLSR